MRELKFRAWDKRDNKWGGRIDALYSQTKDKKLILYGVDEDIVLMQFTGLKDKNGKEIYEGDIIKASYSSDGYYRNTLVIFDEHYSMFALETDEDEENIQLNKYFANNEWEIIGNIYENEEMLK